MKRQWATCLCAALAVLCVGCSSVFDPGVPKALGEWDGREYTNAFFEIALAPGESWSVSENTGEPTERDGYYRRLEGVHVRGESSFTIAFYAVNAADGKNLDELAGPQPEFVILAGQNYAVVQREAAGRLETHYYRQESDVVLDFCVYGDVMSAELVELRAALRTP